MPCNQMVSISISPPRAIEPRKPARFPAAKARIRNNSSRNIGVDTWTSIKANTASKTAPPISMLNTKGVAQLVAEVVPGFVP